MVVMRHAEGTTGTKLGLVQSPAITTLQTLRAKLLLLPRRVALVVVVALPVLVQGRIDNWFAGDPSGFQGLLILRPPVINKP